MGEKMETPPIFYDTHAHLDSPDFAGDLPEVVARAGAAGIVKIISIGTDFESSRRALALAERFPGVFAAVGWHPSHVLQAPPDIRATLRELAAHPKVAAIGEIGLDYHRAPKEAAALAQYKTRQAEIFRQQMEVAAELGLNCVIHQRDAFEDTLAQLRPWAGKLRGVFHCFSESVERLGRVLALGSLVSYTGIVTFKNGANVREVLAATPMDQFMLETDSPFLAPVPWRGRRCEPAYVAEISRLAAEVKKCPIEELSAATAATARKFFPRLPA
ncbi:MAG: TatD family hydrolase [Verrucomicrobiota bacterium]